MKIRLIVGIIPMLNIAGINLLTCLVRYDTLALPIGYGIVNTYCEVATQRLKRKATLTKNDMFRQAVQNRVLFDYISADNWFGSKANLNFIQYDLQKLFILGIKSNRGVALNKYQAKHGQFQAVNTLVWKHGDCLTVYLKDIAFPVKLLKKVFTNEDGTTGILYLVTNDLTLAAERLYQKWWRIEEFHKSIKQNASLAKSPTKTIRTQCNHLFAAMIAFCKLELLKVKTHLNHFAIKHKLVLKANQLLFNEWRQMKNAA